MSEIEKMYENAGIELRKCPECDNNMDCGFGKNCYPPFTAEKQLELIKWLIKKDISDERIINYYKSHYFCLFVLEDFYESELFAEFEEALAFTFNHLWQDLTEEEKQQIKEMIALKN